MSEPFLGEIKLVGFNFAPRGWAFCEGQILPISQNQSLFSLLGNTYGGDGRTTFALPDLRARTPIHFDPAHPQGQRSGEATHALTLAEIPTHTHTFNASNATTGIVDQPTDNLSSRASVNAYGGASQLVAMGSSVLNAGASQPHENMQPYLAVYFCIALQGLFPSRN